MSKVKAITHVVSPGEVLTRISQRYGVTVDAIVKANNLPNRNMLRVGQRLLIPVLGTQPAPAPVTPLPKPLPGTPFTYKTWRPVIGGKTVTVRAVKMPRARIQAEVLYPPRYGTRETVQTMAKRWGADVAINASFFAYENNLPNGRHIRDRERVPENPAGRPAIILDNWTLDASADPWHVLIKHGVRNCFSTYPTLVVDGKVNISTHGAGLALATVRTILAWNDTEVAVIVSSNLTLRQSADLVMSLGQVLGMQVKTAINCDGGGSSTLWFNGKLLFGGGRAVPNALAFKAL